ncbi:hypothetical protein, partial [Staphylococcus pasteuri]|uniref:hypothetical protein n=7 Tax=Staphylococcus TaxID=1279 RepID=UPI000D40E9A6
MIIDKILDLRMDKEKIKKKYWYVGKHEWNIKNVFWSVKFLEEYKEANTDLSYVDYYERKIQELKQTNPDYKTPNFRILSNAVILGLVSGVKRYEQKEIFPPYFEAKKLCKGDFDDYKKYYNLFEMQVEKLYLQKEENNDEEIVHPLFILYK